MREKTFKAKHWLDWFVDPDMIHPVFAPLGERAVASDARFAVAAKWDGEPLLSPTDEKTAKRVHMLAEWLSEEPTNPVTGGGMIRVNQPVFTFADFCLVCGDCEADNVESIETAESNGWTGIHEDDGQEWWTHVGTCPECSPDPYAPERAPAEKPC